MTILEKYFYFYLHKAFFFEVSFQVLIFTSLIGIILWYVFRQKILRVKVLSELEEEEIIRNFQPEDLIPNEFEKTNLLNQKVVSSLAGKNISVNGFSCLNLATHNYLSLLENSKIQSHATQSINKYGVGSCGPRGFYGTVDVHLELEEKLAEFLEVEEACVYSYSFATMASAIPAYCKRGDIIFVDEAVNFSIQKGLDASRSNIFYYRHNNMTDLEDKLIKQSKMDLKNPKKAAKTRKFLITEGIFANTGKICDLPGLIKLRNKFKLRMLLDESVSFGVLGKTGKGVVEYFNIPNIEVDLRIGSLESSLASIGGFCCGTSFIVEHQRLSGLGYCFSASLPPVLAVAALCSLDYLKNNPNIFTSLKDVNQALHKSLSKLLYFDISGDPDSPIKHLYLKNEQDFNSEKKILNKIVDYCISKNVAIGLPEYLNHIEKFPVRPSLRITSNISLTISDIEFACAVISEACNTNLSV
ncbi:serine palmitoyltransferase, putative [Pediculus humanus corporis]|uniref:Serine palmitoyltransferase 1 n=1 Tax=Pediculus humanus subsp. corporis TaxID=121224 RepID=E0VK62_PEDHC|nr:serine palmitoyltransferase, putative [Pediculus humanus corporis]EEB13768.1 serine palmitoyltransferase, putative [Pediculus humanus corporis]